MALPYELQVGKFLNSRSQEIQSLHNELSKNVSTGKLASQQVSRRMRRRAVSHNPKRLPRRLRNAHIAQRTKSGNDVVGGVRRPSRRWRRRPGNLLTEYNRRQGNVGWLETHIWHAKRFHMTRVWGHALPSTPTDKCWRQTFRAMTRGSIMWDVSYHKLIQLTGAQQNLLTRLNTLTSDHTCQVFSFCPGESTATLFRPGQYPHGVVGTVSYMWRPSSHDDNATLWIWCHPGFYEEVMELLRSLFSFVPVILSLDNAKETSYECDPVNKVNEAKLKLKAVPPTVMKGGEVTVTLVENKLNRIRLLGPQTLNVLKHCLHPANEPGFTKAVSNHTQDHSDMVSKCHSSFTKMEAAKPGTVLSLVIMDPRVVLPVARGKVEGVLPRKDVTLMCPDWSLQDGGLWSGEVRDYVSHHRVSDHDINVARHSGTVTTSVASSSVPVMLVATDQGWDMVIPPGWTMPVWMCLVFAGVKVGGLREMAQCQLESGAGDLASWEDSAWCQAESLAKTTAMKESYFRLPPDKRPNYNILGTMSPFARPWRDLTGSDQWFVLRDKNLLDQLSHGHPTTNYKYGDSALVSVKLKIEGKGKLSENTGIYLPLECDMTCENFSLEEVKHKDENEDERKETRVAHQSRLKQLKRQNKKMRSKKTQLLLSSAAQDIEVDENKKSEIELSLKALKGLREEEKSNYQHQNQMLWGSKNLEGLSSHNSRSLVGWVVAGGYSLKEGGEVGVGLITLASLNSLLSRQYTKVLTRQPDNHCYRFAHFTVA